MKIDSPHTLIALQTCTCRKYIKTVDWWCVNVRELRHNTEEDAQRILFYIVTKFDANDSVPKFNILP